MLYSLARAGCTKLIQDMMQEMLGVGVWKPRNGDGKSAGNTFWKVDYHHFKWQGASDAGTRLKHPDVGLQNCETTVYMHGLKATSPHCRCI